MANLFVALKFVRLLRLWRVLRKLDQYLEYVAAILLIMIFCFILLAHWLACVWYMVGVYDLKQHVYHGWIIHLANETEGARNWTGFESSPKNKLPPQSMLYMTSLYFTLSLITSIGFGNVAANTTAEKIVSVMFMIIGGTLIFHGLRISRAGAVFETTEVSWSYVTSTGTNSSVDLRLEIGDANRIMISTGERMQTGTRIRNLAEREYWPIKAAVECFQWTCSLRMLSNS